MGARARSGGDGRKPDHRLCLRHALGLLSALVLLADGTGVGSLPRFRDAGAAAHASGCVAADLAGQASWLDGVVDVALPIAGPRLEKLGAADHPPPSRGRVEEWGWAASRLEAEVHGVIRSFGPGAWRQRNGHVSDRPRIFTIPAQGPPAAA
jgi:hypothetical protein